MTFYVIGKAIKFLQNYWHFIYKDTCQRLTLHGNLQNNAFKKSNQRQLT